MHTYKKDKRIISFYRKIYLYEEVPLILVNVQFSNHAVLFILLAFCNSICSIIIHTIVDINHGYSMQCSRSLLA